MAEIEGEINPTFAENGSCSNDSESTTPKKDKFEFVVPPSAPVFLPTEEEFADPLAYIDKIRHIGEKSGICKIVPPPNWQPPFAVDVDRLKFTPRVQKLNELEAKTRIKLNFLDQIAKFWELQGSSLRIPMVDKRALDLYTLYRLVGNEGGFTNVNDGRKWKQISGHMGYPNEQGIDCILKIHYEKLLYPFELFSDEKKAKLNINIEHSPNKESTLKSKLIKNSGSKRGRGRGRRSCRSDARGNTVLKEEQKGLDKLLSYGTRSRSTRYKINKRVDPNENNICELSKDNCHNCHEDHSEEQMLLCDGCNDSYHTFCLLPPLTEIPKGDWYCPKCVIAEVSKPTEAFGFEQAQKEYNLQQFGEMADTFKMEYFKMPGHLVPTRTVEKEFWRIVSSIDEDVVVEYGADLHTMDHGSGFPTKKSLHLQCGDEEYAYSGWNLNNLPILKGSILGHIKADISGMSVPWMYVGMCFATFCWHNEDHWTYSINYLHWGEPKTWYGVPGTKAEIFEKNMKLTAPELFQNQPDLLHQLVTIMNPNTLMNSGVPVYKIDQQAGEFVVTFPRAYHAGFNQGYNFAEAVNFAPADWVAMGRLCVFHYSQLRRFCVFSHDELICKMATDAEQLDVTVAAATYTDMVKMVEAEKKLRRSLLEWGVTKVKRQVFEQLPDDERQCDVCKTTCFMSALICDCTSNILVCLRHYTSLCKCAPAKHTLLYRYTLDELIPLLHNLKQKAESFDQWVEKVTNILDKKTPKIAYLPELKALHAEENGKYFPKSNLLQTLSTVIEDAEMCRNIIQKLDMKRSKQVDYKRKIPLEELKLFYDEIENLACILDEQAHVKDLIDKANQFESKIQNILQTELTMCSQQEVEDIIDACEEQIIEFPSLNHLKDRHTQLKWIDNVYSIREKNVGVVNIETLRDLVRNGLTLPSEPVMETIITDIRAMISKAEDWEERAKNLIINKNEPNVIQKAEDLIKEATNIEIYLPTENILVDNINSVNQWFKELEKINSMEFYPYLNTIEGLVEKSKNFIFNLIEVERLESYISSANTWKDKTAKIFIKKSSNCTLEEVLSPRIKHAGDVIELSDNMDPTAVISIFKEAANKELILIKNIREVNLAKDITPDSQSTFCVCHKGPFGTMMQCELCKDWFHNSCVSLPKFVTYYKKNLKLMAIHFGLRQSKFLCPNCLRTKRPRLDIILELLKSLQLLHIRLTEGEALLCLTERVMNWQDRAEQLLRSTEISKAIDDIESIIHNYKITSKTKNKIEGKRCTRSPAKDRKSKCNSDNDVHNYSMNASKLNEIQCNINIKSTIRCQIEKLVMEGDLLEVSLEENNKLWTILFMSRNMEKDPNIIDFDESMEVPTVNNSKKKGWKRQSEEIESPKRGRKANTNKKVKQGNNYGSDVTNSEELDSDESSDVDMCAAMTCLQLASDTVNWLQCDGGCEQWFHMDCLGLSVKDVDEDEDYICSVCSVNKDDVTVKF